MTPTIARLALRQTSLTEMLGLLAYVEGFALVVGSLGLGFEPGRVARHAASLVIAGKHPWEPHRRVFPAYVRAVARTVMADRLRLEAITRAHADCPVEDVRMAAAQLGGITGVAELAHTAGEVMVFHRSDDPAMVPPAISLCDSVRALLERLANLDAGLDTAPVVIAPRMAPAPGAVEVPIAHDGPSRAAWPVGGAMDKTPKGRR